MQPLAHCHQIGPLYLPLISTILLMSSSMIQGNPLAGINGNNNNDMLSLSLSDYDGAKQQQQQQNNPQAQPTKTMQRVMADDISGDFRLTQTMIDYMTTNLEQFVKVEHVNQVERPISSWLMSKGSSTAPAMSSSDSIINQNIAQELDVVFTNFWSSFKPIVERIVGHRPQGLGPKDVDFRCRNVQEMTLLREFSEKSSLFSMAVDTFFSELYAHCLVRKLALVVIHQIEPSPLVKQYVDVYLELPMVQMSNEQHDHHLVQAALTFNLPIAHSRIGALHAAADLIFDPRTAMAVQTNKNQLVDQFRQECDQLGRRLSEIWTGFDQLAHYLSSRMNDLKGFNEQVKLASPQLIYGVICGQLSSQL